LAASILSEHSRRIFTRRRRARLRSSFPFAARWSGGEASGAVARGFDVTRRRLSPLSASPVFVAADKAKPTVFASHPMQRERGRHSPDTRADVNHKLPITPPAEVTLPDPNASLTLGMSTPSMNAKSFHVRFRHERTGNATTLTACAGSWPTAPTLASPCRIFAQSQPKHTKSRRSKTPAARSCFNLRSANEAKRVSLPLRVITCAPEPAAKSP
jgi:hypothetical protein